MISPQFFQETCKKILGANKCTFKRVEPNTEYLGDCTIYQIDCYFSRDGQGKQYKIASYYLHTDGSGLACVAKYGVPNRSTGTEWRFRFKKILKKEAETYIYFHQKISKFAREFNREFNGTDESLLCFLMSACGTDKWPVFITRMAEYLERKKQTADEQTAEEG